MVHKKISSGMKSIDDVYIWRYKSWTHKPMLSTEKPVVSDHPFRRHGNCYRQVVAYCCMKVVQKAPPAGAYRKLLLQELSVHYFHAVISNHLSEKPKICHVLYGR